MSQQSVCTSSNRFSCNDTVLKIRHQNLLQACNSQLEYTSRLFTTHVSGMQIHSSIFCADACAAQTYVQATSVTVEHLVLVAKSSNSSRLEPLSPSVDSLSMSLSTCSWLGPVGFDARAA